MITTAEARTCAAIATQIRALLAGLDKLPEAFQAAEHIDAHLAAQEEKVRALDTAQTKAQAAAADAEATMRAAQQKMADAVAACRDEEHKLATVVARRGKIESVEQLDKDIATLTAQRDAVKTDLETLRLKLAV